MPGTKLSVFDEMTAVSGGRLAGEPLNALENIV